MRKYPFIIALLLPVIFAAAQTKEAAQKDTTIYTSVDQPAEYPGGLPALFKFIGDNIMYPQSAKTSNIQGNVYLTFVIEKRGTLSNMRVLRGLTADINKEAIRVMKNSLRWSPAKQGGFPVRQEYTLPISFTINRDTTGEVFKPVDVPAEYPGGMEAFNAYLAKKLRYPAKAKADSIAGKVLVTFVVETDGTITGIRVQKSLSAETDAEAIRLIQGSKTWKPALSNKLPIRQKFTLPVTFDLAMAKP